MGVTVRKNRNDRRVSLKNANFNAKGHCCEGMIFSLADGYSPKQSVSRKFIGSQ